LFGSVERARTGVLGDARLLTGPGEQQPLAQLRQHVVNESGPSQMHDVLSRRRDEVITREFPTKSGSRSLAQ
jgi:hypothetical protein